MRVALLYPPPWKICGPGETPDGSGEGPPEEYREGDLDADFHQTPYGLFSLGAQALRAGHAVKVLNLSAFPWSRVEEVVRGSFSTAPHTIFQEQETGERALEGDLVGRPLILLS
jgi:hypothetical protein